MFYINAASAVMEYAFIFLLTFFVYASQDSAVIGIHSLTGWNSYFISIVFWICAGLAIFMLDAMLVSKHVKSFKKVVEQSGLELKKWADKAPVPTVLLSIVLMAGVTLFLELVLIRWQAGLFPVYALYKNFTLLACFCGLGIGYASSRTSPLLLLASLPMLAVTLFLLMGLRYGGGEVLGDLFQFFPVTGIAHMGHAYVGNSEWLKVLESGIAIYFLLAVTFLLNVLTMVPLAQFCGYLMERTDALRGYGCNLLGSTLGVILLFLLSWLWVGPVVWFGLCAMIVLAYLVTSTSGRRLAIASVIVCMTVIGWPTSPFIETIYSPYQLIQKATNRTNGLMFILTGGMYYQKVFDFHNDHEEDLTEKPAIGYYKLPYNVVSNLDRVAIVGAGSGNDVEAALLSGAKAVDAVEIDPVIRRLGVLNHPNHPYRDERVNSIIDDARDFLRTTNNKYNAIVYGVLDSHILVSHGSSVRLDSFVYTKEGLLDAYNRLEDGGLLCVSFALPNPIMGRKIFRILSELPGIGRPVAILTKYDGKDTTTFMVRKGAEISISKDYLKRYGFADMTESYVDMKGEKLDLPTDNWPFFYMTKKEYPTSYVISLFLTLIFAAYLIYKMLPGYSWKPSYMPFFFLGTGFMLVETKAITELGLLFGNTWHVVGITIIGVLVMAFLANIFVMRFSVKNLAFAYLPLMAAIIAGYVLASKGGITHVGPAVNLGMAVLLTCPLLFSGIAFSSLVKSANDVTGAMAYNLAGAMLGGLLEYNSMQFGFAFLYLIALGLYALAWAISVWKPISA